MEEDAVAATAAPDLWETADLDGAMSRLLLSNSSSSSASPAARRVSSSPDLTDDHPATTQEEEEVQRADDPVAQVDQFLREALEKPRERLQGSRHPATPPQSPSVSHPWKAPPPLPPANAATSTQRRPRLHHPHSSPRHGRSQGRPPLQGEVGVFSRADWSALFEMGNTRVIAAVYCP